MVYACVVVRGCCLASDGLFGGRVDGCRVEWRNGLKTAENGLCGLVVVDGVCGYEIRC